ncbi:hypothetical protein KAH55_10585 [bacterium]|nr:hypothetical protein [bacterium]
MYRILLFLLVITGFSQAAEPVLSSALSSGIEVITDIDVNLNVIALAAGKFSRVRKDGKQLVWYDINDRGDDGLLLSDGRIFVVSEFPLQNRDDMQLFRSAYAVIMKNIVAVTPGVTKDTRNQRWQDGLMVYNYEPNSYQRLSGYLRGSAELQIPPFVIKNVSLYVFADGWQNQVHFNRILLKEWFGSEGHVFDLTGRISTGTQPLTIRQMGGERPYFEMEFFLKSSVEKVVLANEHGFQVISRVECRNICDLKLSE